MDVGSHLFPGKYLTKGGFPFFLAALVITGLIV